MRWEEGRLFYTFYTFEIINMLQLINKFVLKQCCVNSKKIADLNARAKTTILRIKYRNISQIRQWFPAYNIKSINDKRQKQINRTVSKLKAFVL